MGRGVTTKDFSMFILSKFCVKPFQLLFCLLTALQYLPYLIHGLSIALLSIWSPGSGAWVGPGVSN